MVGHGEENPIKPLPAWFRTLLIGPSSDFVHLQCDIGDLDDWGRLGRSPTSVSSIKKPPSLPRELTSCMKSSTRLTMPKPCPRSNWSSPAWPRRQPDSKPSQKRLSCCPHTLVARTATDEDVSSNQRVMLLALRTPGGYRSPRLI